MANISLVLYLHDTEEAMGMTKSLPHDIKMKKDPQTKEGTSWVFADFYGVMQVQCPTCSSTRKFHQWRH